MGIAVLIILVLWLAGVTYLCTKGKKGILAAGVILVGGIALLATTLFPLYSRHAFGLSFNMAAEQKRVTFKAPLATTVHGRYVMGLRAKDTSGFSVQVAIVDLDDGSNVYTYADTTDGSEILFEPSIANAKRIKRGYVNVTIQGKGNEYRFFWGRYFP